MQLVATGEAWGGGGRFFVSLVLKDPLRKSLDFPDCISTTKARRALDLFLGHPSAWNSFCVNGSGLAFEWG